MKTHFPKIKLKTTVDYAAEMSPEKGLGFMDTVLAAAQKSSDLDKMLSEVGSAVKDVVAEGNKANGKQVDSKSN